MAISGKCYLSLHNHNSSANRGACLQDCRRKYSVKDKETEMELEIDNEYIMSPKDLSTIHFLDNILDAGVTVLKIEGRGRSPEYVKTVTQCYREAVDAWRKGTYTPEKIAEWEEALATVYNRGFWDGYYLGRKLGEWSPVHGSLATEKKLYVGIIANYFTRQGVAHLRMDTHELSKGDHILIIGPTTGVCEETISSILVDDVEVEKAGKGDQPTFRVSRPVRRNDKVYKVVKSVQGS